MRLGIFGGTFDPVHVAHLIVAEQCREQGALDAVWFLPAASPPHKPRTAAAFAHRAAMLALAIAGQPAFRVEEMEHDRPGPSYTADTLDELARRRPGDELVLIVGADSLHDLPAWYQPERIVRRAELLVAARPGVIVLSAEHLRAMLGPDAPLPRVRLVEVPQMELASRDLRRRLSEGRSVRYLVPRAVEAYLRDKGLYGVAKQSEPEAGATGGANEG